MGMHAFNFSCVRACVLPCCPLTHGSLPAPCPLPPPTPPTHTQEPDEADPTAERDCSAPFKISPYRGKYATLHERCPGLNVQKLLAGMAERGSKGAVVECAPMALDQGFLDAMEATVAVFTNLSSLLTKASAGSAHYFDDEEEMVHAMMRLFTKLADRGTQAAVVNKDDPYYEVFTTATDVVSVVTYSMNPSTGADVFPDSIVYGIWETEVSRRQATCGRQGVAPCAGRGPWVPCPGGDGAWDHVQAAQCGSAQHTARRLANCTQQAACSCAVVATASVHSPCLRPVAIDAAAAPPEPLPPLPPCR